MVAMRVECLVKREDENRKCQQSGDGGMEIVGVVDPGRDVSISSYVE